jgi:ATP-binding cassette subfamily B protein
MSMLNFGQGAIIALGVTLVMVLATDHVATGKMGIGDLVLVNAFLLQLFIPLGFLGIVYRQIKYSLADMDLIFKLLDTPPEVSDKDDATELSVTRGEIAFKHVDFGYTDQRQIVFDLNFTIAPGKKFAVVGHSGAGKSTLSRLLYRFYDVNQGEITIDDQSIATVTQDSLRQAIGIVPQDTVLFNDTIFYNIAYGRPGATREEVIRAAELAHIKDFVNELPDGWDSVVGERGLKLSGGEKQRVAIARAILKRPQILIFDEATSSLDSQTELAINKTLASVAENHTTLVIAHRLSTIVDADRILVMEKGRIVESGTHAELMALAGQYRDMWELQRQEREQEEQTGNDA